MRFDIHFEFHFYINEEGQQVDMTNDNTEPVQRSSDIFCEKAEKRIEQLSAMRSFSTIENTVRHSVLSANSERSIRPMIQSATK